MNEEDIENNAETHGRVGTVTESFLKTLESRAAVAEAVETHLSATKPEEDDFGPLFGERETSPGKTELRLRFLPDGDKVGMKAVLVICLLYKRVRGFGRVRCSFVDDEVAYLFGHAPNAPGSYITRTHLALTAAMGINSEHGEAAIKQGYAQRVGLASGGFYELTAQGENYALSVARDMIRRA
jgi:hypothetical protein